MRGRYAPPAGSMLGEHTPFSGNRVILDRATKRKAAVGSIVVVLVFSFFAILDANRAITSLPQYQDILIVSIGNDRATRATSGIITENLAQIQDEYTNLGAESNEINELGQGVVATWVQGTRCTDTLGMRRGLRTTAVDSCISSLASDLSKYRVSLLVIVAHGEQTGIAQESSIQQRLDWCDLVALTTVARPSLTVIASCYGANAAEYSSKVIGFDGLIDAFLAGYVTSLLLMQLIPQTPSHMIADAIASTSARAEALLIGSQEILPLGWKQDWANLRTYLIAICFAVFFVGAYYVRWSIIGILGAILAATTGFVIGLIFQNLLNFIRGTVGVAIGVLDPNAGKIFNAVIGVMLSYGSSALTPLLLPSIIAALRYLISGTMVALVMADTPMPWVRIAAISAGVIGIVSIIDTIIQLL
ncbi:MAG: hypothetical protein JSW05_06460 [Candidatus Thorarchaeota archaeon]|nr:MAG: hypothetical protein JSW05_06460 [Candidatus Thorarchaeota archaeon]